MCARDEFCFQERQVARANSDAGLTVGGKRCDMNSPRRAAAVTLF
jgi:hypothetical protein